jgi:Arc/MetJ family transcription regulator
VRDPEDIVRIVRLEDELADRRTQLVQALEQVDSLRAMLAEQDARGLRLAGELEHAEAEVKRLGEWKARRQAGQESIDISLLRAEVGRLQEELAGWMNEDTHEVHALRGKVERLQEDLRLQKAEQVEWAADNERLRAALEQLLSMGQPECQFTDEARNALAEEKEK